MLAGLQIHIRALDSIIPESFIFILDSTDRSFLYRSSNCPDGAAEIMELDRVEGIETLMEESSTYSAESEDHVYMIKRLSDHIFLGYFAFKKRFTQARLSTAKNLFLKISS